MSAAEVLAALALWPNGEAPSPVAIGEKVGPMSFSGSWLLEELRRNPVVNVGGSDIDFSSNCWRLEESNGLEEHGRLTVFFKEHAHRQRLKLHCLVLLSEGAPKPASALGKIKALDKMLREMHFPVHRAPSLDELRQYFEVDRSASCYSTVCNEKTFLKEYLLFEQGFFGVVASDESIAYLDKRDKRRLRAEQEANKHQEVPFEYLNALISACEETMDDPDAEKTLRVAAAACLIYTQVGMRTRELATMTVDALRCVDSLDESCPPIAYIEFRSPKGARSSKGYKTVRCIANDITLRAYRFLVDFCEEDRARLGSDSLIALPGQRKKYPVNQAITDNIQGLLIARRDVIPCINTLDRFPDLHAKPAREAVRKRFESKEGALPLSDDDVLVYPVVHQFRVTVCTALYRMGVDMNYIKEHMGHLTNDMAAYYVRADEAVEREFSQSVYRSIFVDDSRLMGKNAERFVDLVKAHIEQNMGRAALGNEDVALLAAEEFPLRLTPLGICIQSGQIVPCSENQAVDDLLCAFHLCPNHCHMYFAICDTYEYVVDQAEIIRINERRGHVKAARKELKKLQNVIKDSLMPQLDELEIELKRRGRRAVLDKFPHLENIIGSIEEIKEEAQAWLAKS